MNIQAIAGRLVELNRAGDHRTVYEELFSPDIISIENWDTRDEHSGLEAVLAKAEKWEGMVEEVHSITVSEPLVAEKSFAVTYTMDVTYKEGMGMPGGRSQMTELGVYRVNDDGKIYYEEFFA